MYLAKNPDMKRFLKNSLKLASVFLFLVSFIGCEKQPAFERLNDISGNYTITKATFLKRDNVTDSASYTNFGSISISGCKKNSFQNCPGEYKIVNEPAVSVKASYIIGGDGKNILQFTPNQINAIAGFELFGMYEILEESDSRMILRSGGTVVFNHNPVGRVILELDK